MRDDEAVMNEKSKGRRSSNVATFSASYLQAKKDIDDVALNRHVLDTLIKSLPSPLILQKMEEPLEVLEVGGGIGTMLARLVERHVLAGRVRYRLTDNDATHLHLAREYLSVWAKAHGFKLNWLDRWHAHLCGASVDLDLLLEKLDLEQPQWHRQCAEIFDLVIAHGVLDLFNLPEVLLPLFACLKKGGLAYFTCNFDGETIFLPESPNDRPVIDFYHTTMERRCPGASYTGRRLLASLADQHQDILAVGSSDWFVHPRESGYTDSQKHFLLTIIDMVGEELTNNPETIAEGGAWVLDRRRQVEDGRLLFLAKHLDMLARKLD